VKPCSSDSRDVDRSLLFGEVVDSASRRRRAWTYCTRGTRWSAANPSSTFSRRD